MKFPIDVIMLDIHRTVLGIHRGVSPWRIVLCERGTTQVIEVNPGTVEVEPNTRLDWGDKAIGNR